MKLSLRPYQTTTIDRVLQLKLEGKYRQLVCLPTGCGKTITFAALAKHLGVRTLVLAHRDELIEQARDKFQLVWPEADIGIVKGTQHQPNAQVVVASVQSAARDARLAELAAQDFKLLIIDEAHHAASDSYRKISKTLGFEESAQDKLLVGFTATPMRADGKGLGDVFECVSVEHSLSTMIKAGYLCELHGIKVTAREDLSAVRTRGGDFVERELSLAINTEPRNSLVVNAHKENAPFRKAVAFCADVAHSKDLARAFNEQGYPAAAIYGAMETEDRREALTQFRRGELQVLTTCGVLTEGFDEPSIGCVLMARPTQSTTLYTQCIGRGTRLHPGKTDCLVIDFFDKGHKLDKLATLEKTLSRTTIGHQRETGEAGRKREKLAGTIVGVDKYSLQLFEVSKFIWTQRGLEWVLTLSREQQLILRYCDGHYGVELMERGVSTCIAKPTLTLEFAQGVAEDWARRNARSLALVQKDAPWRQEPASGAQLRLLASKGIATHPGLTKGDACALIDQLKSKVSEMATPKQIAFLRSHGICPTPAPTKKEAQKLIHTAKQKREHMQWLTK